MCQALAPFSELALLLPPAAAAHAALAQVACVDQYTSPAAAALTPPANSLLALVGPSLHNRQAAVLLSGPVS